MGDWSAILRTDDSGFNWSIINTSYNINDVYFFDENSGFLIGGYTKNIMHFIISRGNLFSTSNGGQTWNFKLGYSFREGRSLIFYDNSLGFSLASWGFQFQFTQINKTIDGGNNWITVFESESFSGRDIFFHNEQTGFTVGRYEDSTSAGAGIMITSDGGDNWN